MKKDDAPQPLGLIRQSDARMEKVNIIYVGRDLACVHYFTNRSPRENTVIVTMDYMRGANRFNPRPAWHSSIMSLGYDHVHVYASWDYWFHTPELPGLASHLTELLEGRRVVLMGNSMGGYGALKIAPHMKADRVVALAPQTSTTDTLDIRYKDKWRSLPSEPLKPSSTQTLLLIDPGVEIDLVHAQRVMAGWPRVELIPLFFHGHWLDRAFSQKNKLSELIESAVRLKFDKTNVRAVARSARLESLDYKENLERYLLVRKSRLSSSP